MHKNAVAQVPTSSGTSQSSKGRSDLDAMALETWMRARVAGFAGPLTVERLAGGQSNPTYRLLTPERSYILRRKPPGALLASAHAVEREYRVMEALRPTGFPVPDVLGLCVDPAVIGSVFYVMELVEGRILWDGRLPGMTQTERRTIYETQVDTLAALHRIEPKAVGLEDFGKPGNYFARQVSRWSRQYRESDGARFDDLDRLVDWLPRTLPLERAPRIVHGDYRIDNMVLAADAPRVAAVLDWELATLGDPLADLTYWLMHWVTPEEERGSLTGQDLAALGIPAQRTLVDRYSAATGLKLEAPLEWYLAYNLFRLAAILHGVADRARRGMANNPRGHQAAARIGPIAARAWSFARLCGA